MAPIVASDLMTPNGPVEMFFFPGEHSNAVEARLSAWITSTYADPRLAPFASDEDRLNQWCRKRVVCLCERFGNANAALSSLGSSAAL
jgi:hypothetical protein